MIPYGAVVNEGLASRAPLAGAPQARERRAELGAQARATPPSRILTTDAVARRRTTAAHRQGVRGGGGLPRVQTVGPGPYPLWAGVLI
jgi:hypothetical protein